MKLTSANIIVVKIGSLLITNAQGQLRNNWLDSLACDIEKLTQHNTQVIIVSSGAVSLGRNYIASNRDNLTLPQKQAAAACGQPILITAWQNSLSRYNLKAAQILITADVTENRRAYLNASNTLHALLQADIIPIINENDTTATAELRYGDNDKLAARVAQMIAADILILLSDVDGLYDSNPKHNPDATLLHEINVIDSTIEKMANANTNIYGTGGMASKIEAAKIATQSGCQTIICNGTTNNPLQKLATNNHYSVFNAKQTPLKARKRWIIGSLHPAGNIIIDNGAELALQQGKSLLPAGIISISGDFGKGDMLAVYNQENKLIAKGLSNYDSSEAKKLIGHNSSEIINIIGYAGADELIHRNNMVLEQQQT